MPGNGLNITFLIDRDKVPIVKRIQHHVSTLFDIHVEFDNHFKSEGNDKQWISLKSNVAIADQYQKAKDYILAHIEPEITITRLTENVTKEMCKDIEQTIGVSLVVENGNLTINGTEMNVAIAESMLQQKIQECSKSNAKVANEKKTKRADSSDSHERVPTESSDMSAPLLVAESPPSSVNHNTNLSGHSNTKQPAFDRPQQVTNLMEAHTDCASEVTSLKGTVNTRMQPSSHQQIEQFTTDTSETQSKMASSVKSIAPSFASRPSHVPPAAPSTSKSVEEPSGEMPRDTCLSQWIYFKNYGISNGFSIAEVEETLIQFDMNEIIRPADFRKALEGLQQLNKSVTTDLDDSSSSSSVSTSTPLRQSLVPLPPSIKNTSSDAVKVTSDLPRGNPPPYTPVNNFSTADNNSRNAMRLSSDAPRGNPPLYLPVDVHSTIDKNSRNGKANANDFIIIDDGDSDDGWISVERIQPTIPPSPAVPSGLNWREQQLVAQVIPPAGRHLRYIIVDGNNVAMSHGNNKVYSVRGIQLCLEYFLKRGHQVTVFVPQSRLYSRNTVSLQGRALLEKLSDEGFIKFTPARRIDGRVITSYDDRYMLNLAEHEQGIIVSNDQFRDLLYEKPSYKEIIETRLLQYVFVGEHFMPPDDPLGRNGPNLNDFLCMPGKSRFVPPLRRDPSETEVKMLAPSVGIKKHIQTGGRPNQRQQLIGGRSKAETDALFHQLSTIFSEESQKRIIRIVLERHKNEKNISKLSNYCLNSMST